MVSLLLFDLALDSHRNNIISSYASTVQHTTICFSSVLGLINPAAPMDPRPRTVFASASAPLSNARLFPIPFFFLHLSPSLAIPPESRSINLKLLATVQHGTLSRARLPLA